MEVSLAATGPAAPDVAWQRYADTRLWATWSPQITGVDLDAPGPLLAVGAHGVVHGWAGLRIGFVIDAIEPEADDSPRVRRWSWTVEPTRLVLPVPPALRAAARLHLEHAVIDAQDGGTLTTLTISGAAPVVVAYAPLARLALRQLVA